LECSDVGNASMMARRKDVDASEEPLGNGNSRWHLVRGIPIVFILTMTVYAIVNAVGAGWYASAMNSRLDAIEKIQTAMAPQAERLTRVEEKLVAVQATASRIEAIVSTGKTR
jgi:carbon starvation protein CstA